MALVDEYSNHLLIENFLPPKSSIYETEREPEQKRGVITFVSEEIYRRGSNTSVIVVGCKNGNERFCLEFDLSHLPAIIGQFPPLENDFIEVSAAYKNSETYTVLSFINNGRLEKGTQCNNKLFGNIPEL